MTHSVINSPSNPTYLINQLYLRVRLIQVTLESGHIAKREIYFGYFSLEQLWFTLDCVEFNKEGDVVSEEQSMYSYCPH